MYLVAVCAQAQDGTIMGTVVDNAGRPATGVRVYAMRIPAAGEHLIVNGIVPTNETNKDGSFSIENLRFGTYTLYTADEKDGYADMWHLAGLYREGPPRSTTVTVTAATPTAYANLLLGNKAGIIAVAAFDASTGLPVKDTVFPWRMKSPERSIHTRNSSCPWRIDKIMRRLEYGTTLDNASARYTNRNPLGMQICG
jgi:hypothetical protein